MKRYVGTVALALGLTVVAAGCGSTRFVVVDNDGAGSSSAAGGGGAAATPTTTATGAAASQPATDAQLDEFEAAFEQALTIDNRKFSERQKALSAADDLAATFTAVVDLTKDLGVTLDITDATVTGDTANATVTVNVGGQPYAEGVPVPMVREDGKWRITRDGACAVLALGSPCPDAPAS